MSPLGPNTKLILLGVAMLSSGALGWKAHDRIVYVPHLKADLQAKLNAEVQARQTEGKGVAITVPIAAKLTEKKEAIHATTTTLIKAVPLYVPEPVHTPGSPPPITLPVGFERLHDYAALGVDPPVPAPTLLDLAGPSGTGLPQLSTTLVGNYGKALAWRAEVLTWRAWYVEQCKAWELARKDKVAEAGCSDQQLLKNAP